MDAFQSELVAHAPRLRRLARALARDPGDADDLTQLTLERALLRRDQWRPETRLDSWMFRIMKNAWIDEARRRARWSKVTAGPEQGELAADPASATLDVRLGVSAVERAMAALPDEQRIAVALVLIEGLSYDEAAAVLEMPVGTVNSRLSRGRAALQAALIDQGARP